ncbi:MAG TPA: VCBS repeat-containing protein [Thermoanaerobaculia bacterium]|nr:VCBS repeat-containing protein [Thermoanaerobaculia bacterium]
MEAAEAIITPGATAAYGDFGEDGLVDVAYGLSGVMLAVALNRGGGVFEPVSVEPVRTTPALCGALPVAAADTNRDGHVDLIYRANNLIFVFPAMAIVHSVRSSTPRHSRNTTRPD